MQISQLLLASVSFIHVLAKAPRQDFRNPLNIRVASVIECTGGWSVDEGCDAFHLINATACHNACTCDGNENVVCGDYGACEGWEFQTTCVEHCECDTVGPPP